MTVFVILCVLIAVGSAALSLRGTLSRWRRL